MTAKTYFITRHNGAVEWAAQAGFDVTNVVSHADESFFSCLAGGRCGASM